METFDKPKSIIEFLTLRLDDIKCMLSLFQENKENFFAIDPAFSEAFER